MFVFFLSASQSDISVVNWDSCYMAESFHGNRFAKLYMSINMDYLACKVDSLFHRHVLIHVGQNMHESLVVYFMLKSL